MSATGIQPRGDASSPRGISHVIVLRAAKIMSRHCLPGEVIKVEASNRQIMPMGDGLTDDTQIGPTETLLDQLIRLKIVKPHQIKQGDRVVSVRPKRDDEDPKIETATSKAPAQAERAVARQQRGSV